MQETTVGLDLGKDNFQVHRITDDGIQILKSVPRVLTSDNHGF
jgi:hypothetical protein